MKKLIVLLTASVFSSFGLDALASIEPRSPECGLYLSYLVSHDAPEGSSAPFEGYDFDVLPPIQVSALSSVCEIEGNVPDRLSYLGKYVKVHLDSARLWFLLQLLSKNVCQSNKAAEIQKRDCQEFSETLNFSYEYFRKKATP